MPSNSKGIDLEQLHKDVERIVRSILRRRFSWALQDLEDLTQDVFLQILELNGTEKEHDPEKGSLGGYVWRQLMGAVKRKAALMRGGIGDPRSESTNMPLSDVPECIDPSTPNDPQATPEIVRHIYLKELHARATCPSDLAEYLAQLQESTHSEDLLHALDLESKALAARRRRLIRWLQAEGELPDDFLPTDHESEYPNYKPSGRNCSCGAVLLTYQKLYCSKGCEAQDKSSKPDEHCLECKTPFKPHPGKKFCTKNCKARHGRRLKSKGQEPPLQDPRQMVMPWTVDPNNEADDAE